MDLKAFFTNLSEIIYILCGFVSIATAIRGLRNEKSRIGTFLFWFILGIIFILGKTIPYAVTGGMLVILGLITVTNQLQIGTFKEVTHEFKVAQSEKFKNKYNELREMLGSKDEDLLLMDMDIQIRKKRGSKNVENK